MAATATIVPSISTGAAIWTVPAVRTSNTSTGNVPRYAKEKPLMVDEFGLPTETRTFVKSIQVVTASGVLPLADIVVLNGTGALAMTLNAADVVNMAGRVVRVISSSAFAHTITAPAGTFQNSGSAGNTTITFSADVGSACDITGYSATATQVTGLDVTNAAVSIVIT